MRDAGREDSERGETLAVRELALELAAIGDVPPHLDHVRHLAARIEHRVERCLPAALPAVRIGDRKHDLARMTMRQDVTRRARGGGAPGVRQRTRHAVVAADPNHRLGARAEGLEIASIGGHDTLASIHDQHGVDEAIDELRQHLTDLLDVVSGAGIGRVQERPGRVKPANFGIHCESILPD